MRRRQGVPDPQASFQELQASVLFCPGCRAPQPARERMLLYLPDGELHEYRCAVCGTSVGSRKVTAASPIVIAP